MTLATFTPPQNPSLPLSQEETPRTNTIQFGDGYRQSAPDGLNAMDWEQTAVWENLTKAERDSILTFLRGKQGSTPFSWTVDGETATYICESWEWSKNNAGNYELTAKFKRDWRV